MKKISLITLFILCISVVSFAQSKNPILFETFETDEAIDNYEDQEYTFKTGVWRLKGAKQVSKTKDVDIPKGGGKALQFRSNSKNKLTIEMKFDLPDGASKVSMLVATHAKDLGSQWVLQYSTDQGSSWKRAGKMKTTNYKTATEEVFNVKVNSPVRFRIMKMGLGSSENDPSVENGRLLIDDFKVYN